MAEESFIIPSFKDLPPDHHVYHCDVPIDRGAPLPSEEDRETMKRMVMRCATESLEPPYTTYSIRMPCLHEPSRDVLIYGISGKRRASPLAPHGVADLAVAFGD
jgi:hypothetical protein